jgi:hypothetical protein
MTHKPIKTEFRWTGDGFGNAGARLFKQLKRVGDIALYERSVEKTGRNDGYEVIKVGRHNGYSLGGQFIEPAETYPGASQFGKTASFISPGCQALKQAEMVFQNRLTEAKVKDAAEAKALAEGTVIKKRGRPRKIVQ